MDNAPALKCTSCALGFSTCAAQREHYRTDLHRYNLKRRSSELPPVSEAEFLRRKAAAASLAGESGAASGFLAKCSTCGRSFSSRATLDQHLRSKKHLEQEKLKKAEAEPALESETGANPVVEEGAGEGEATRTDSEGEEEVPNLSSEACIFCNVQCANVENALVHMWRQHGFHIPDAEYLVDLTGLLRYVAEKVKVGCICLYCNGKGKNFASRPDVQRHMMDKGHCKLRFEDGEDLHEFKKYFDYRSSYTDRARGLKVVKQSDGDDDDAQDDDDDMSYETVDSDYEELNEDDDEEVKPEYLHTTSVGELMLPDGRVLGNREYVRIYRQRYRPHEESSAVVAVKAETQGAGGMALVPVDGQTGREMVAVDAVVARRVDRQRRVVMKVMRAARKHAEKVKLRTEMNRNRFHKRPQIGV